MRFCLQSSLLLLEMCKRLIIQDNSEFSHNSNPKQVMDPDIVCMTCFWIISILMLICSIRFAKHGGRITSAKFEGSNFQMWKFQMYTVFAEHEINNIIASERVKPKSAPVGTTNAAQMLSQIKSWNKDNKGNIFTIYHDGIFSTRV